MSNKSQKCDYRALSDGNLALLLASAAGASYAQNKKDLGNLLVEAANRFALAHDLALQSLSGEDK